MSDANKALFRRFIEEVINAKNVDKMDLLIGENWLDHNPPPGTPPGIGGMKQMMGMFFAAFPDLNATIDQLIAEGDIVAAVWLPRAPTKPNSWALLPRASG